MRLRVLSSKTFTTSARADRPVGHCAPLWFAAASRVKASGDRRRREGVPATGKFATPRVET